MGSYPQREANEAVKTWKRQTLLGIFRPLLILIPLAVVWREHDIPHTNYCFNYREVFVFGVRIIRFQTA